MCFPTFDLSAIFMKYNCQRTGAFPFNNRKVVCSLAFNFGTSSNRDRS